MGNRRRRRAAIAMALVTLSTGTALGGGDPAEATVAARAGVTQVASSSRWSAVSSLTTAAPGAGSASVSGGVLVNSRYVWVVNNGTSRLTTTGYSGRYQLAVTGLGVGRIDLLACSGATASWNETTDACTNGTLTLLSSTNSALPTNPDPPLPLAPGGMLRLRVAFVGVTVLTGAGVMVDVTRRSAAGTTTTS